MCHGLLPPSVAVSGQEWHLAVQHLLSLSLHHPWKRSHHPSGFLQKATVLPSQHLSSYIRILYCQLSNGVTLCSHRKYKGCSRIEFRLLDYFVRFIILCYYYYLFFSSVLFFVVEFCSCSCLQIIFFSLYWCVHRSVNYLQLHISVFSLYDIDRSTRNIMNEWSFLGKRNVKL